MAWTNFGRPRGPGLVQLLRRIENLASKNCCLRDALRLPGVARMLSLWYSIGYVWHCARKWCCVHALPMFMGKAFHPAQQRLFQELLALSGNARAETESTAIKLG